MQRRVFIASPKNGASSNIFSSRRVAKDIAFNYDDYKNDVALLRANANVRVTDIATNANVSAALQRVRNMLQTMSGEKAYSELRNIIDSHFGDLAKPVPYTIGAQFRGWDIKTNMDGTDFEPCVAVRIGALQRPGYLNKCKYVSMYADWSGDRFSFTNDIIDRSSESRPLNRVVINVPFVNVNTFPGFSTEEKNDLRSNDISEVCIIGFRPGSNDYVHLTNGQFISLDNVKTRYTNKVVAKPVNEVFQVQGSKHHHHQDDCNDGYGAAAWIFFILIILVIIFLFYFFWK